MSTDARTIRCAVYIRKSTDEGLEQDFNSLDAGNVPDGYSTGWMYDAKRRLVYGFTVLGEAWAIEIEPKTARLLEKTEG